MGAEILLTAPLSKWIELEPSDQATVFPSAMCFTDADNDGMAEFVVGSTQGDLFVFKGLQTKACKKASALGMITVVGAGDILQKKKNVIYVVTGEGTLYTFFLPAQHIAHMTREEAENSKKNDAAGARNRLDYYSMQKIPPNIVMSALSDIDGDGFPEILLGMTDRVVRSFKWVESPNQQEKGSFVALNKWEFAGQIGNLSATLSDGVAQIYVSQPGLSCCRLKASPSHQDLVLFDQPVYHNPVASRSRHPIIQSHVLGGISFVDPERRSKSTTNVTEITKNIYAMSSFDGTMLVCNEDSILWEHQTHEHLIAIQSLPLRDEFLVAASSGAVYIFNEHKKMMKLLTTEPINGFTCGLYGKMLRNGEIQNNCAFATICSGGRIVIYYDLDIPYVSSLPSFWRRPLSTP